MLLVPVGGAEVKASVVPIHVYATPGSWTTFSTTTRSELLLPALDNVKSVVEASPLKVSFVVLVYSSAGPLPKYGIYTLLFSNF